MTVMRRINHFFRRRDRGNSDNQDNHSNDEHMANESDVSQQENEDSMTSNQDNECSMEPIIKLRSTGYSRQMDGSVTLSLTLDKDEVECCVCLSSMTSKIYRCGGAVQKKKKKVCHNICSECQWQMTRIKSGNNHTKTMQCPICKVKGPFVRNRALERQLFELSQPCSHHKYGCNRRFFPWDDDREIHQNHLCIFQPVDCLFCSQTIPGGRVNFVEHLAKSVKIRKRNSISIDQELNEEEEEEEENMDNDESMENMENMENNEMFSENEENENEENEESENEQINDDESEIKENEEVNERKKNKFQQVPPCLLAFYESKSCLDLTNSARNIVQRHRNEFIVNYNLGIILCFIPPSKDCECWKVYAISISPRHGISGNSRVYIQCFDDDKMNKFVEKEQSLGLVAQCLHRPNINTIILNLGRLHPTSLRKLFKSYPAKNPFIQNHQIQQIEETEKENDFVSDSERDELEEFRPSKFLGLSPCSDIQCGFIYGGNIKYDKDSMINNLGLRVFTLEQSLKVGAVIDARDFTGKWYQSEVIAVQDQQGNVHKNLDFDNDDFLEIRRAKIHYLGYSQNYDEWINVDTDSHRIAQRGTFTIGPDLRAIRRNTTNLQQRIRSNSNQKKYHQFTA